MDAPEIGQTIQPFPTVRPEIHVEPSSEKPFTLLSRRMPGWGLEVAARAEAWIAWYDPPAWTLTSVTHQRVVRPAEIHAIEGVEIENRDWEAEAPQWRAGLASIVRLTNAEFQWLAVSQLHDDKLVWRTFLDEGFDRDWGRLPRLIEDDGRLSAEAGGHRLVTPAGDAPHLSFGAGVFHVTIGPRSWTCLRALQIDPAAPDADSLEQALLAESFFARADELVLFRRYNGRRWKVESRSPYAGQTWDQRFPANGRLVINGATFVHWYDCLTNVSCGF